jgi:hypothetical protein
MTFVLLLAESPTPAPAPTEMEPWEVSPGLLGFLFGFFLLAVAVVPLFLSMTKHMRRVDHNERLRQRAEEEAARADGEPAEPFDADPRPGSGHGGTSAPDAGRGRGLPGPSDREDRSGDGGSARPVVQSPTD